MKATGIYSAAGSTLTLHPTASTPCTSNVVNPDGPSRTDSVLAWEGAVTAYNVKSAEAGGDQTRIDKIAHCASQTRYKATAPNGTTPWSDGPTVTSRFDSAAYMAQYGVKGAIFSNVLPWYQYARTDASVKSVAEHIFDALYLPQLTYPVKPNKDIPGNVWNGEYQPIHRNFPNFNAASATVARKNLNAKNAACRPLQSNPGEQCDEFPFASTKEGAGKGDGNFSVRYVPGSENGSAGAKLAVWYGQDRIIDGDAYGFRVK
ncbi:NucA/NucB deoxyribonuclease domain-containing protein [Streptomyces albipurpureus]|uniref:NucA/NucB deoxyribonuclease domain-containing protein n=1 Tax=Streptomyces albipurpureus TaxID=2897419 RepID=A0ABT0UYY3_9ACTN|nr:NucA/NucB deoxyribonuclease domain-containing protein [Streptomyces sp. CWNU-1]MCM2393768.1 NucA/NucB deoxyribonuclease domain-containing protein [Streptomyces sp. CWNU-1]